jgi:hypothetical protein
MTYDAVRQDTQNQSEPQKSYSVAYVINDPQGFTPENIKKIAEKWHQLSEYQEPLSNIEKKIKDMYENKTKVLFQFTAKGRNASLFCDTLENIPLNDYKNKPLLTRYRIQPLQ